MTYKTECTQQTTTNRKHTERTLVMLLREKGQRAVRKKPDKYLPSHLIPTCKRRRCRQICTTCGRRHSCRMLCNDRFASSRNDWIPRRDCTATICSAPEQTSKDPDLNLENEHPFAAFPATIRQHLCKIRYTR